MSRFFRSRYSRLILVLAALGTGLALSSRSTDVQPLNATQASALDALPLFAFYDPSGDAAALRQQIASAKSAGVQGWIVSWTDTVLNDSRLRLLMRDSGQEDFKLAMNYQGLDSPESQVARDFQTFATQYAASPVFYKLGGQTLTLWSGTWGYSPAQVQAVTTPVRGKLLVLGTQQSVASYDEIARYIDGDACSCSAAKLTAMAEAVHGNGGYWIAPFSAGDVQSLRAEYAAAIASSPDILSLTSWNEFSGSSYLADVAALRGATVPVGQLDQDSSSSSGVSDSHLPDGLLLAGTVGLFVGAIGLLVARGRRRPVPPSKEHR
jgi:hypothetical protein